MECALLIESGKIMRSDNKHAKMSGIDTQHLRNIALLFIN